MFSWFSLWRDMLLAVGIFNFSQIILHPSLCPSFTLLGNVNSITSWTVYPLLSLVFSLLPKIIIFFCQYLFSYYTLFSLLHLACTKFTRISFVVIHHSVVISETKYIIFFHGSSLTLSSSSHNDSTKKMHIYIKQCWWVAVKYIKIMLYVMYVK